MNKERIKSKINLMALNKRELEDYFISIEEKPFRATQIIKWVHQRGISDISAMTDLSKDLREKLKKIVRFVSPKSSMKNYLKTERRNGLLR